MGSGKGKVRRAQTQNAPTNKNWGKFVEDSRISSTNVYQYYLGYVPLYPSMKEHEKVTQELFKDAVDLRMVKLPPLYGIESFKFAAVEKQTLRGVSTKIEISLKRRLRAGAANAFKGDSELVSIPYKLVDGATMADPGVPVFLNRLVTAVDYLLMEAK